MMALVCAVAVQNHVRCQVGGRDPGRRAGNGLHHRSLWRVPLRQDPACSHAVCHRAVVHGTVRLPQHLGCVGVGGRICCRNILAVYDRRRRGGGSGKVIVIDTEGTLYVLEVWTRGCWTTSRLRCSTAAANLRCVCTCVCARVCAADLRAWHTSQRRDTAWTQRRCWTTSFTAAATRTSSRWSG